LSDDDLIDESQMKMTMESDVHGNGDSVSMPDPNISQEVDDQMVYQQPGDMEYRVTKDRYVGNIDPVTKLRDGQGCYTYTNPYFQYQGSFEQGKKTGEGVLIMRDGSKYAGEWENGEIMGQGTRTYDDGTEYVGEFCKGEKNGYGEVTYGRRNAREEYYKGAWVMNIRHGFGQLLLRNGNVYKGNFVNNQPLGDCQIFLGDGGSYAGEVTNGIMHGIGELKQANGFAYAGKFENGLKSGTGRFYIQNSSYSLEGMFENDKPTLEANHVLFDLVSPFVEEEVVDPKAKKDPKAVKKDAPFTEEEEAQYGSQKIYLECKSDIEPKEVKFTMRLVFQGPDYEDPNPPEEDEKTKKKPPAKGAAAEEPEIRMLTPEPVTLDQESGRVFAIELGQNVKFLIEDKKEEAKELKDQGQEIPEEFYQTKWVRFWTDQSKKPRDATQVLSSHHASENDASAAAAAEGGSMEEAKAHITSKETIYP